MSKHNTFKNYSREIELFTRRVTVAGLILVILSSILLGRLTQLQIFQHQRYTALSQQNLLKVTPIEPNRGLIFDRNGILLAENVPVFSLEITRTEVLNLAKTIGDLRNVLPISQSDVEGFYKLASQKKRYEPIPLKVKLSENEIAQFYVNSYRFPGVSVHVRLIRHYPFGSALAHVIGYVARISENELANVAEEEYSGTNNIGKTGIEKIYETQLHGHVGYEQVETDAAGRVVRVVKRIPPTPGENIYLTIDSKLQLAAEQAFIGRKGAFVSIEPKTGHLLALVSEPSFDPNLFVTGISQQAYRDLQSAPGHPLYNRVIHAQYPPASTIKPYLALGGLMLHFTDDKRTVWDPGWYQLKGSSHVYHDWRKGGHGKVDLPRAIMVSCDIYFFELAHRLGISRMGTILKHFGYGQKTGIDLPNELSGLLPSNEWKKKKLGQKWYKGDTINSGIGQGYMLVTPIQMAVAVSTMANAGSRMQPQLVLKRQTADNQWIQQPAHVYEKIETDPAYWKIVREAMHNVVASVGGTGYRYGRTHYSIAGKTGTAQVFTKHYVEYDHNADAKLPEHLRNNSLMITFAPYENPLIASAIVVEHDSLAAVVLMRNILDNFFNEGHAHEKH